MFHHQLLYKKIPTILIKMASYILCFNYAHLSVCTDFKHFLVNFLLSWRRFWQCSRSNA